MAGRSLCRWASKLKEGGQGEEEEGMGGGGRDGRRYVCVGGERWGAEERREGVMGEGKEREVEERR